MTKVAIKLLVDRSGSMLTGKRSAEDGIQSFIDGRKDEGGKQKISLSEFDTEYDQVYDFTDIALAPKYTLVPRGFTALYDSIAKAVKDLEEYKSDKERDRWLIIMTDGLENASKEHTKNSIKELLESKQAQGWHVVYLGANQDAIAEGFKIGVSEGSSLTYDVNSSGSALKSVAYMMSSPTSYTFSARDRNRAMGRKEE